MTNQRFRRPAPQGGVYPVPLRLRLLRAIRGPLCSPDDGKEFTIPIISGERLAYMKSKRTAALIRQARRGEGGRS